jgi:hypothetical protein
MACHAGLLVEEFDHLRPHAHLELRLDEGRGHRRGVALDCHMIINVDAGPWPLGLCIGLDRQGLSGGAVACRKETWSGAGQFLEGAGSEGGQEGAERRVDLGQREAGVGPQPGDHPALHPVHPHFDLGLVRWLGRAGGDHGDPLRGCEIGRRALARGLRAMGAGHRSLAVVGDDDVGPATEGGTGPHMGANPVRETLRPRGVDRGRVGGAQDRHTARRLTHLTGTAVDDRDALAGIVDTELLPRALGLPQDQVERAGPGALRLADPAVLEALRRGGLVCLPQEEHGDALAFQRVVHRGPVGSARCEGADGWGWRKQPRCQRGRIEPVGQGPGQACHLGARHIRRNGGAAQAQAPSHLSITEPNRPFETSHFVHLPH